MATVNLYGAEAQLYHATYFNFLSGIILDCVHRNIVLAWSSQRAERVRISGKDRAGNPWSKRRKQKDPLGLERQRQFHMARSTPAKLTDY